MRHCRHFNKQNWHLKNKSLRPSEKKKQMLAPNIMRGIWKKHIAETWIWAGALVSAQLPSIRRFLACMAASFSSNNRIFSACSDWINSAVCCNMAAWNVQNYLFFLVHPTLSTALRLNEKENEKIEIIILDDMLYGEKDLRGFMPQVRKVLQV